MVVGIEMGRERKEGGEKEVARESPVGLTYRGAIVVCFSETGARERLANWRNKGLPLSLAGERGLNVERRRMSLARGCL